MANTVDRFFRGEYQYPRYRRRRYPRARFTAEGGFSQADAFDPSKRGSEFTRPEIGKQTERFMQEDETGMVIDESSKKMAEVLEDPAREKEFTERAEASAEAADENISRLTYLLLNIDQIREEEKTLRDKPSKSPEEKMQWIQKVKEIAEFNKQFGS